MFIGSINCCHLIPLSVTLTMAGGHKVMAQSKTCLLHFLAHFSTEWIEICCGNKVVQAEDTEAALEQDCSVK